MFSKLIHLCISQQQYRLTTDYDATTDLSALCYSRENKKCKDDVSQVNMKNNVIKGCSYILKKTIFHT